MAEKILNWVIDNLVDLGFWNYVFAFVVLILCGFGLPIPEDITLVAGGMICGLGATNIWVMLFVCFAGVLFGDATMYFIGKVFGYRIQHFKPMRKVLTPERFEKVQDQFSRWGIWVLFAARFMPGLRSPIFMAAGMSRRVPFVHFLLMDGLAALISVPAWVFLAFFCADTLPKLISGVRHGQNVMRLIILAILLTILILIAKSHLKQRLRPAAAKAAAADPAADGSPAGSATPSGEAPAPERPDRAEAAPEDPADRN